MSGSRERRAVFVCFGVLLLSPFEARAVEFAYGFEGCPPEISGKPGESRVFDVFVTLTTSDNPGQDGAQGWGLSLTADGGTIEAIEVDGIHVSTLLDDDGNPATPPVPRDVDLADADFQDAELAEHFAEPARSGAVSVIYISTSANWGLLPSGTQRIARVTVRASIPSEVSLAFEDGFRSVTGNPPQPVNNQVYFQGNTLLPAVASCVIRLDAAPPSQGFLRGDCDGDGEVRGVVTDSVFLLNHLFLGGSAPPCLAACDANGDGAVIGVVTDAVYALSFNFLGGAAPPEPFPDCGQGTPDDEALGCETPPEGCAAAG